jgi:hypothetical protein
MDFDRRHAFVLAAAPIVLLSAGRAWAVAKKPATVLTPGSPTGGQAKFVKPAGIESAVQSRATGIYLAASLTTPAGHHFDTLTLINQGAAVEVHTKRAGGAYLAKQPGAQSVRTISTAKFDQLIGLAGGINRNVEGTAAKAQFLQVAGLAPGGTGGTGTGGTSGGGTAPKPCPADWASKSVIQRNKIEQDPVLRQQYAGCLQTEFVPADPRRRDMLAWLWEALPPLVPEAQAADESRLVFFSIAFGNLFNEWKFEYNPQAGYTAFNAFGITAIWSTGG